MKKLIFLLCILSTNVYTQTIPNGGFENWTNNMPVGWIADDTSAIRKVLGYRGNSAVKMETVKNSNGQNVLGSIHLSINPSSGWGGVPFNNQFDTLTGYYTFFSPIQDSGIIIVKIKSPNSGNNWWFYPKLKYNFTYFELPISSSSIPDTIDIILSSNAWNKPTVLGANLVVDELQLKSSQNHTGLPKKDLSTAFKLYPVPAKDFIYFNAKENREYSIVNLEGKELLNGKTNSNENQSVEISELENGVYFLMLKNGHLTCRKFIKQ